MHFTNDFAGIASNDMEQGPSGCVLVTAMPIVKVMVLRVMLGSVRTTPRNKSLMDFIKNGQTILWFNKESTRTHPGYPGTKNDLPRLRRHA